MVVVEQGTGDNGLGLSIEEGEHEPICRRKLNELRDLIIHEKVR
jgi:hypothetical protein